MVLVVRVWGEGRGTWESPLITVRRGRGHESPINESRRTGFLGFYANLVFGLEDEATNSCASRARSIVHYFGGWKPPSR